MTGSSAADPAETLSIRLCGRMAVEIGGREIGLRGRQARLVVAYLAWNRRAARSRDELIELLWPRDAPVSPDDVLTRAAVEDPRARSAPGTLEGRRELMLAAAGRVDRRRGRPRRPRARRGRLRAADWAEVCRAGHDVLDVTAAPFLLAHDHPWVEQRRRELEELRLRTLERVGSAGARARRLGHRRRRAGRARDRRVRARSARAATCC